MSFRSGAGGHVRSLLDKWVGALVAAAPVAEALRAVKSLSISARIVWAPARRQGQVSEVGPFILSTIPRGTGGSNPLRSCAESNLARKEELTPSQRGTARILSKPCHRRSRNRCRAPRSARSSRGREVPRRRLDAPLSALWRSVIASSPGRGRDRLRRRRQS